jgi:hypothetical protein
MNPTEARTTLLAQHERLRLLLGTCTRLAHQHRAGEPVTAELDEALAQLRDEFAEHNRVETAVIADLLQGPATWGSLLVDRMVEEHSEVAERIGELAEELDAHMYAEERTFLSPMTLRDDVIRRRTRDLTPQ